MGAFTYVVPVASEDNCVIFCIILVLPMGWVDSFKYSCIFSETLTYVVKVLVHTCPPVPAYSTISEIPDTGQDPPHTIDSLTHIDCYMDDVITAAQEGLNRQHKVFNIAVRALKWHLLTLPGKNKDYDSVKKQMVGEGEDFAMSV